MEEGFNYVEDKAKVALIRMACFGPRSYMTLHLQSPIA